MEKSIIFQLRKQFKIYEINKKLKLWSRVSIVLAVPKRQNLHKKVKFFIKDFFSKSKNLVLFLKSYEW